MYVGGRRSSLACVEKSSLSLQGLHFSLSSSPTKKNGCDVIFLSCLAFFFCSEEEKSLLFCNLPCMSHSVLLLAPPVFCVQVDKLYITLNFVHRHFINPKKRL